MDLDDFDIRKSRCYNDCWCVYYRDKHLSGGHFSYSYSTLFWPKQDIRRAVRKSKRTQKRDAKGSAQIEAYKDREPTIVKVEPTVWTRIRHRGR